MPARLLIAIVLYMDIVERITTCRSSTVSGRIDAKTRHSGLRGLIGFDVLNEKPSSRH